MAEFIGWLNAAGIQPAYAGAENLSSYSDGYSLQCIIELHIKLGFYGAQERVRCRIIHITQNDSLSLIVSTAFPGAMPVIDSIGRHFSPKLNGLYARQVAVREKVQNSG